MILVAGRPMSNKCRCELTPGVHNSAAVRLLDALYTYNDETTGQFEKLESWIVKKQLDGFTLSPDQIEYLKYCFCGNDHISSLLNIFTSGMSLETDDGHENYWFSDIPREWANVAIIEKSIRMKYNEGFTELEKRFLFYTNQILLSVDGLKQPNNPVSMLLEQDYCRDNSSCLIDQKFVMEKLEWIIRNKESIQSMIIDSSRLDLDDVVLNFFQAVQSSDNAHELKLFFDSSLYLKYDELSHIMEPLDFCEFTIELLQDFFQAMDVLKVAFPSISRESLFQIYNKYVNSKKTILSGNPLYPQQDPLLTSTMIILRPLSILIDFSHLEPFNHDDEMKKVKSQIQNNPQLSLLYSNLFEVFSKQDPLTGLIRLLITLK